MIKIKQIEIRKNEKKPFKWSLHERLNVVCGERRSKLLGRIALAVQNPDNFTIGVDILSCGEDGYVEEIAAHLNNGKTLRYDNSGSSIGDDYWEIGDTLNSGYFSPDLLLFSNSGLETLHECAEAEGIYSTDAEYLPFDKKIELIVDSITKNSNIVILDTPDLGQNSEKNVALLDHLLELAPDSQFIIATESNEIIRNIKPGFEFINLDENDYEELQN